MDVFFRKSFVKDAKKISVKIQKQAHQRIDLFLKDRFHPQLHFHALKGGYNGFFSINVNSDYRIVFSMDNDANCIYLIRIGTHSHLYG